MHSDVMEFYGFYRGFDEVDDFETAHHRELLESIESVIDDGTMIALTGEVGSGKTRLLHCLQTHLQVERGLRTAWSLAVEKERVTLATLIAAICYDLTGDHTATMPRQAPEREAMLLELLQEQPQPVVLFVDDSHDIPDQTLIDLLALQDRIRQAGSCISVVLAGLPALADRLPVPAEGDIDTRVFGLNGVAGYEKEFIGWLIEQCRSVDVVGPVLTTDAIDLLAGSSRRPLRLVYSLRSALEGGYQRRQNPVTAEAVERTLDGGCDGT